MKILVTGASGFIGYHVMKRLVERGDDVLGLDSINTYYDVSLKFDRLRQLGFTVSGIAPDESHPEYVLESTRYPNARFVQLRLEDEEAMRNLFETERFDRVVHLAAQAGVRYSIEHPRTYIDSNIIGFFHIIEACRHTEVAHLVYASSSSVYGMNTRQPFSTRDNVDHPISLYAASKKSNELMAHTYSHLFGVPTTGLRFFTVYGPWGRPDMALFLFTKAILEDREIDVYNYGKMKRDFTYIDDITGGVVSVLDNPPSGISRWNSDEPEPNTSSAPYRIYNIGNNSPVDLMYFVREIEKNLGKQAQKRMLPMQAGDVPSSHADVSDLVADLGYQPHTTVEEGIRSFVAWYKEYYEVK